MNVLPFQARLAVARDQCVWFCGVVISEPRVGLKGGPAPEWASIQLGSKKNETS